MNPTTEHTERTQAQERGDRLPWYLRMVEGSNYESPSRRGGVALSAVFLACAAIILSEDGLQLRSDAAHAAWREAPCTVVSSGASRAADGGLRFAVRFRYEADGAVRESDRWSNLTAEKRILSIRDAAALSAAHPPGSDAVCRVSPDDPSDAFFALEKTDWTDLNHLPRLVVAVLFLFGGAYVFVGFALNRVDRFPALFLAVILSMAAGLLWSVWRYDWPSIREHRASAGWPLARAVVTECDLEKRPGRPSDPWQLYLRWEYEREGVRRPGDNVYREADLRATTFRGVPLRFALDHPVGSEVPIRVDPDDPSYSRLDLPVPGRASYLFNADVGWKLLLLLLFGWAAWKILVRVFRPAAARPGFPVSDL